MKWACLFLIMGALCICAPAAATTLTGTVKDSTGANVTGYLYLELNQAANLLAPGGCGGPASVGPGVPSVFTLTNGVITAPGAGPYTVYGLDCLSPATGVWYRETVTNSDGATVLRRSGVSITGASVDLGNLTIISTAPVTGTTTVLGDVTGTVGATVVSRLQGVSLLSTAPTTGQLITYNGAAWAPASLSTSTRSGFTLGSVIFQGASTLSQDNANFFWDATNHRLGIGTSTPGSGYTAVAYGQLAEVSSVGSGTAQSALAITGTQAADGFLGDVAFGNSSIASTDNRVGVLRFSRAGANNSGQFDLYTRNAGVFVDAVQIAPDGRVGLFGTPRATAGLDFAGGNALVTWSANGVIDAVFGGMQLTNVAGIGWESASANYLFLGANGTKTYANINSSGNVYVNGNTASSSVAQVGGTLFTQTANVVVNATVTETTLIGTGVGSATMPANLLIAGRTIRVKMYGKYQSTASAAVTLRLKAGVTTLTTVVGNTIFPAGSDGIAYEGTFTCRTTGASGTVMPASWGFEAAALTPDYPTTTVTVDTTTSLALDLTVQFGAATSGITVSNLVIEVLN